MEKYVYLCRIKTPVPMTTRRLHTTPHRLSRRAFRQAERQAFWHQKRNVVAWGKQVHSVGRHQCQMSFGTGFRIDGIQPIGGRPNKVDMVRKALPRFATKGFVEKPMRGKLTEY